MKQLKIALITIGLVIVSLIQAQAAIIPVKTVDGTKDSLSQKNKFKYLVDSAKQVNGMFTIYQDKQDYYFEIPDSLMSREMLIVNRVLKVPYELNDAGINKGINYDNTLIRFELDKDNNKLLIRNVRPKPHYPGGDLIAHSVNDNFISPLMGSLKIEGYNSDSSSVVVKVNDLFDGSNTVLNNFYNDINIGGSISKDLSRILRVKSFEDNIAVVSELSSKVTEGYYSVYLTVEAITSIVLLPQKPAPGRFLSPRVGYFTVPYTFYSDNQNNVERKEIITRWKLEPKDRAAYNRGELTEPMEPIVFYLDKSTPGQWRKYMKEGIEEWQVAFEKAGFRNAILAKEFSDDMDTDNIRYSSITYVASEKMNAMGPSVYDPRSGEIIQADIIWWHNVLSMLRNWIVVQTGAVQEGADRWDIPEELMGEAIRFVAAHEVGHSLGLRHNMIASAAYPSDSLRSNAFVQKWGTSASIMDYSRYNYLAQPGDGVREFAPKIGPYDLFAIEYGYRWTGNDDPERDQRFTDSLLALHNSPVYRYSEAQDARSALDPRAQTEDLGDDAIKAASYGIQNLKRIMPRVIEITSDASGKPDFNEAGKLYHAIISHWNNLVYHPLANIGGIYLGDSGIEGDREAYAFVQKEKQIEAFNFLMNESVSNVEWLFDNELSKLTFPRRETPSGIVENAPSLLLKNAQSYIFWDLLDNKRLMRMSENEQQNGASAFTLVEMMEMLFQTVFEAGDWKDLTVYERSVQKGLVDALIQSVSQDAVEKKNRSLSGNTEHYFASDVIRNVNFYGSLAIRISDAVSAKRALLEKIMQHVTKNERRAERATANHYNDIGMRIKNAFEIR